MVCFGFFFFSFGVGGGGARDSWTLFSSFAKTAHSLCTLHTLYTVSIFRLTHTFHNCTTLGEAAEVYSILTGAACVTMYIFCFAKDQVVSLKTCQNC